MKKLTVMITLWCGSLLAQGTVTVTTVTTVSASAGSGTAAFTCTFTSGGQIQSNCSGAGAILASTFPTPIAAPGTVGNFTLAGKSISWLFKPSSTAGKTDWQVAADGVSQNGTF